MPGRGSYGPGGKWIHDRAHRILEKGELQKQYGDRAKQVAYALATQQAHKMKKTPKKKGGYGTVAGRAVARAKFQKAKSEYRKTAVANWQQIAKKQERDNVEKALKNPKQMAAIRAIVGAVAGGAIPLTRRMGESAAKGQGFFRSLKRGVPTKGVITGALIGGVVLPAIGRIMDLKKGKDYGMKTAAMGGQDLRSFKPMAGSFPTDDSKGHANKMLNQSQNAAEVGPNPAFTTLKPKGPKLQDITVKMPSPKGSLPKIGSAGGIMDEKIKNDPLIQYIRKEAGLEPASADQAMADTNDVLNSLFTGPKTKKKFDEKNVEKLPDKW